MLKTAERGWGEWKKAHVRGELSLFLDRKTS